MYFQERTLLLFCSEDGLRSRGLRVMTPTLYRLSYLAVFMLNLVIIYDVQWLPRAGIQLNHLYQTGLEPACTLRISASQMRRGTNSSTDSCQDLSLVSPSTI